MRSLSHILFVLILTFTIETRVKASEVILEVLPGDVILMGLNCSICPLIEDETQSLYSHSAVVLEVLPDNKVVVAQALGKVHTLSLESFVARRRSDGIATIYRTKELDRLYRNNIKRFNRIVKSMKTIYEDQFKGLPFDPQFQWNNSNSNGDEMLYCSEFVAKLLNKILKNKIEPVMMNFSRNWDRWNALFSGRVPQGELGLAPQDFASSRLFFEVFDI